MRRRGSQEQTWSKKHHSKHTHLVVVRSTVRSSTDASETPSIHQAVERMVVAVLEKERHYQGFKQIRFEYLPGPSVRHPADDIGKLLLAQNGIELDGKLLHPNRGLHGAPRTWGWRGCKWLIFQFLFGNLGEITVASWNKGMFREDGSKESDGQQRTAA